MKKLLLITAFLIPILTQGLIAEDLPLLAVPTITAVEVSDTLASTSRNMLETALIKTGRYIVLSYTDMEEILEAQAFSLSGCTDESCAIVIGELLAADNIVVGDLSKVGENMVLSIRLVNVTSGHTVSGEVVTINDLETMQESIFKAAYALTGLKYIDGNAVTERGAVYVMAPEGMSLEITLDGKAQGPAPVLIENIPFGVHILEAAGADGYLYRSEFSIASQDIIEITADVKMLKGNLFLTVLPPSAEGYEIKIDGLSGRSGLNRAVTVGSSDIRVEGAGWYFIGKAKIETGKTTRLIVELKKAGSLQIFGPEGITASIKSENGAEFPVGNIKAPTILPEGSYSYSIEHEDYKTINGNIDIVANIEKTVNPEYEYNEQWIIRQQIAELEAKKIKVQGVRKVMLPIAWSFTGIGGAGLALGGGMEGAIQYGIKYIEDTYVIYSASTDTAEIKSLGDKMFKWKEDIPLYRDIRNYSLIGAGSSLLLGGILFLCTPSVGPIDAEITELQERLK